MVHSVFRSWCAIGVVAAVALGAFGVGSSARAAVAYEWIEADPADKPMSPVRTYSVLHVILSGDLDCGKLASDFVALRDKAKAGAPQEKGSRGAGAADLFVLELDGHKWRSDVVLAIVKALRDEHAPTPFLVYLAPAVGGQGAGVGTGQLAIGMIADACYCTPQTKISFSAGDELPLLAAAPGSGAEKPDGELIDRQIRGLAWTALQDKQSDALLTTLIPRPSAGLFALGDGTGASGIKKATRPMKLATDVPEGTTGEVVTLVPPAASTGGTTLGIDAALAERIGLVQGTARSVAEVLSKQGLRARSTRRERLSSGLNDARKGLEKYQVLIDEIRREASAAIEVAKKESKKKGDQSLKQKDIGTEELASLERASGMLEAAEKLTTEYPELLGGTPPGVTSVGQTKFSLEVAWRNFFQNRRNDLDTLKAKARTLSLKEPGRP